MLAGAWLRATWIAAYLLSDLHVRLVGGAATHHLRLSKRAGAVLDAPPYQFKAPVWARPKGDFKPISKMSPAEAEYWPKDKQKWRERQFSRSASYSDRLKEISSDDEDTWMWHNASDLPDTNATTAYWNAVCNGTNTSKSNPLPGDIASVNATDVMSKWTKEENSTCTQFVGDDVYTDPLKALIDCGSTCDSISVTQCATTATYRLCAAGEARQNATQSLCDTISLVKPATYVSPAGLPRPPQETKFWEDFCKYRLKGKLLRILWEDQVCSDGAVKELTNATDPVQCNEATAQDSDCSNVFDFRFGDDGEDKCRCVRNNFICAPTASDSGNVWTPI